MPIWRKCGCFRALSFGNRWKVISSRRQSAVRLPEVPQLRLAHFGHGTVLPWSAGGVGGFRGGPLAFACCCAELRVIFRWPCSHVCIQTSSHVSPVLAANSVFVASNTRSFVHLQSSSEERGRQETGTGPIFADLRRRDVKSRHKVHKDFSVWHSLAEREQHGLVAASAAPTVWSYEWFWARALKDGGCPSQTPRFIELVET